jgi:hypothetical protein
MPGFSYLISSIQDTVNRVLPAYNVGFVRPRGLAIPVDPWMRGTTRWARRIGGEASVWRPDTRMKLEEKTNKGEYVFYVDRIPDSMFDVLSWVSEVGNPSGPIMEVSDTQRVTVLDVNAREFTITVGEEVLTARKQGDWIRMWGFPVTLEGGVTKGTTSIRVASPLRLTQGDSLQIPVTEGDPSYCSASDITSVTLVEEDAEGKKYALTLGSGVFRDVDSDETIYVRAYPAYFSGRVPLPDYSASFLKNIGPFLLDWMSGPLVHQEKAVEYFSIQRFRADRTPLTPMLPSDHNGQVNVMPIKAEQMLFWQKIEGDINHDGVRTIATCNDEGHFRLVEKLAPHMETEQLYATGHVSCMSPSLFNNNESLDIDDGSYLARFEFKAEDPFTPAVGKTTIDVSTLTTESQVALAVSAAISASPLQISASTSGKVVLLVNQTAGFAGNVLIEETVASSSFAIQGMSGGGGDLRWLMTLEAGSAGQLRYRFVPNADVVVDLVAGTNTVPITFPATDPVTHAPSLPATHLDLRIKGEPGEKFLFSDWSLQGSRVSYVETETVVRVETDQWAGGFLFLKPLWPSFDLLKAYPDLDKMNGGALLL